MLEKLNGSTKKKVVIGLCSIFAVAGGAYGFTQKSVTTPPEYVLSPVTKGNIVVSISGSGQVSGQNQLDIKPQVSATLTSISVKQGQQVKAGDPLFQLDTKDAKKAVRDASISVTNAQISLQSAQASLAKLQAPPDTLSVTQAQDQVNQAKRALENLKEGPDPNDVAQAESDLAQLQQDARISADGVTPIIVRKAYDSAVPTIKSIAQTLQQAVNDADSIIGVDNTVSNGTYVQNLSALDTSKLINAKNIYPVAKQCAATVKTETDSFVSFNEDVSMIDAELRKEQTCVDTVSTLLQNTYDALINTPTSASFSQSSLQSLENTISSDRSSVTAKTTTIVSETQTLSDAHDSYSTLLLNIAKSQASLDKLKEGATADEIASAQEKVTESEQSLAKLMEGTDPTDITSAKNTVAQRRTDLLSAQINLSDAQQTLNEYTITAPFDGTIGNLTAKVGDSASPSTALATLVTDAKIAPISLNEVDASKVRVGNKVTLTFDAIPDLSIAGVVNDINPIGTVSQGVVNYDINIVFQTQDERVKPGMSVSASIITNMHTDVLTVPNSAIKTVNGQTFVQTLPNIQTSQSNQTITTSNAPVSKQVQVGLADDTSSEITSGLNEGDMIITRTIDTSKTATTSGSSSQSSSALRVQGLGGGGFTGGARF